MGMGLFEGKNVLVFGVANDRSIAWGISQALHQEGARLGFTYLGDTLERRVRPLAEGIGSDLIAPCDVTDEIQLRSVFNQVQEKWGSLDVLIHSVAFANHEDLDGRFVDTPRDGYLKALEVSSYSLISMAREAEPLLRESKGNVLTMTYYGSVKVVPHYNVMGVAKAALEACVRYLASDLGPEGIRVNAISAGPIKTLAASGIKDFRSMLGDASEKAPLKRNVSQEDVGNAAKFLASDLGNGVTGEILYVDSGYNIMGM